MGPEAGAAVGQGLIEATDLAAAALAAQGDRRANKMLREADELISERLASGERLRADGLMSADDESSIALLEGALRSVEADVESRKVRIVAHLYCSFAFDEEISLSDCLHYLQLVSDLSWRQILALAYFADEDTVDERKTSAVIAPHADDSLAPAVAAEVSELARRYELIGLADDGGNVANPTNTWGTGAIDRDNLHKVRPTRLGEALHELGGLDSIVSGDDLDSMSRQLLHADVARAHGRSAGD